MGAEQNAKANNFKLHFGAITVPLDVVVVRRTGSKQETGLKSVCPTCFKSVEGGQRMHCPSDDSHGPFKSTELRKARKTPEGLVVLTDEEVKAIKDAGKSEVGSLELQVADRAELEFLTHPDDDAYRLRLPSKNNAGKPLKEEEIAAAKKVYDQLLILAQHPTLTLYGVGQIGGGNSTSGYKLTVFKGQLELQSLVRPQDVADADDIPAAEPVPLVTEKMTQLMEAMVAPVDVEAFSDARKEALEQIMMAKALGTGAEGEAAVEPEPVEADDLMAMLEASLLAVQTKAA